mmetsp:Transcript_15372/g.37822  ORF Transcript_15372/g.37822 Transcript_15372/m.37822 type:complete len:243 (+) Transcript_15372:826-1554(+)
MFLTGLLAALALLLQPAAAQFTYVDDCNTAAVAADVCCDGTGGQVCSYLGGGNNGLFTVSKGSCRDGENPCFDAGREGAAVIGENSCKDNYACHGIAFRGSANIGDGSCHGVSACYLFGKEGTGVIGGSSCKGENPCRYLGTNGQYAQIGNNSCNCDYCCACLRSDRYAQDVYIPDNSCNALGSDQCCESATIAGSLDTTTPLPLPTPVSFVGTNMLLLMFRVSHPTILFSKLVHLDWWSDF